MTPTRRGALVAGLLYFSTHVTSVGAVVAYGAVLSAPSAASASDSAIRAGVALETLLALGVLGTGVVLLPILQPYGAARAHAFSALRTLEAAVIAAGTLPMLALVWLRRSGTDGGVADALVALHQASFLVGQGLVISVNTIVLASLLITSGIVPRWIGVLGAVGGTLVLAGNAGQLFGVVDRAGALAGVSAVAAFAFELSFAAVLVFRGVRTPDRHGAALDAEAAL